MFTDNSDETDWQAYRRDSKTHGTKITERHSTTLLKKKLNSSHSQTTVAVVAEALSGSTIL